MPDEPQAFSPLQTLTLERMLERATGDAIRHHAEEQRRIREEHPLTNAEVRQIQGAFEVMIDPKLRAMETRYEEKLTQVNANLLKWISVAATVIGAFSGTVIFLCQKFVT